jgi:hypothetical protein
MAMSNATTSIRPPILAATAASARPRLRLVADARAAANSPLAPPGPIEREQDTDEHVLVAGGDASARARMLSELRSLLPPGTSFIEADETWELVARAAGSRMVVLTGDLGGTPAASLLRLLARRNPALPVLAVGQRVRADRRSAVCPEWGIDRQSVAARDRSAEGEHLQALDATRA